MHDKNSNCPASLHGHLASSRSRGSEPPADTAQRPRRYGRHGGHADADVQPVPGRDPGDPEAEAGQEEGLRRPAWQAGNFARARSLALALSVSRTPQHRSRAVGPLADSNPCAHGHAHRRSQTNRPSRDVRAVHGLQDPLHVRHEPVANPEALQGCTQLLLLCPRPSARNRSPPAASNANPGGACVGVP